MAGELKRLNSIYNTNLGIADELSFLRRDVNEGLQKIEKATISLKNKNKVDEKPGAWRKVANPTIDEQYPLVRSDVEQFMKKLDIL